MTSEHFGAVLERLVRTWPTGQWGPEVSAQFAERLADLPYEHVMAAIDLLDGRDFQPTAGLIRRHVIEMQIDAPTWGDAWALIRRLPHMGYTSPHYNPRVEGTPDAKGAEWHCGRHIEAMPAPLRAFVRAMGRSQLVDNLIDTSHGEARLREKYQRFMAEVVENEVLAAVEGADDLPRIARAKREARPLGEIMGTVVKELEGGRAA